MEIDGGARRRDEVADDDVRDDDRHFFALAVAVQLWQRGFSLQRRQSATATTQLSNDRVMSRTDDAAVYSWLEAPTTQKRVLAAGKTLARLDREHLSIYAYADAPQALHRLGPSGSSHQVAPQFLGPSLERRARIVKAHRKSEAQRSTSTTWFA